ncbi:MAG: sulfotransferase family protein [Planctomycetales bacterium]
MNHSGEPPTKTYGSAQGIFSIWQGMDAPTWCRLLAGGPPLHWRQGLRLAMVSGMSIANSLLKLAEHLAYGSKLRRYQLQHAPVFILGHWRSGTTLLHELLSNDPRLITPNLYQTLSPHHCLLSEALLAPLTRWMLPKTRPMDNIAVSWESPQEDETALCILTGLSPYVMLAYQGQRWKYERFFEQQQLTPRERDCWTEAFLTFLKKVAMRHEARNGTATPGARLLLKSPTHTYRIRLLLELFPTARFIHIVRNPYDVFSSAMYLRERLFEANALGRPRHGGAEEDVWAMYEHLFRVFEADRHLLPPKQFYELRFEDLERDPIGQLAGLYAHLELDGFDSLAATLGAQLDQHRSFRKNQFEMSGALRRRIFQRWQPLFERYDYPSGLAEHPPSDAAAAPGHREKIPADTLQP